MSIAIVPARPAAAIILLREGPGNAPGQFEVFMVRRHVQSEFMPDVYVFPGGSVQRSDSSAEVAALCAPCAQPELASPLVNTPIDRAHLKRLGLRVAALREMFEEAGVLLAYEAHGGLLAVEDVEGADAGRVARFAAHRQRLQERTGELLDVLQAERLILATDQLGYYSHWITPEGVPKRFDTYFFVAPFPAQQTAMHDMLETTASIWISPQEALRRTQNTDFPLARVTQIQLGDLAAFPTSAALFEHVKTLTVPTILAVASQREINSVFPVPSQLPKEDTSDDDPTR